MQGKDADEKLRQEFNNWVLTGRAEGMEGHHLSIAEQTIRRMDLKPGERVLDLGCGTGWATRVLARLVAEGPVGFGQVLGLDISDEMIARARGIEGVRQYSLCLEFSGTDSVGRKLLQQSALD
jgi:SAM-dependent methyltransferase